MPAAIPVLVYWGASAIPAIAAYAGALSVVAGFAVSAYQAQRARKKARDAWNSSLSDRLVAISTVDAARTRVYGRVRNVDGVLFKGSYGANKERLVMVLACAGHEVDAIEDLYLEDKKVTFGAPVSGGWLPVTSAPFTRTDKHSGSLNCTVSGGTGTVTLPSGAIASTVNATIQIAGGNNDVHYAGTVSLSGSVVTVTAALDPNGQPVNGVYTVSYQTSAATPYIWVWKFTGAPGQNLSSVLSPMFPDEITASHKFEGIAGVIIDFAFNPDIFPNGVPPPSVVLRGAKVKNSRTEVVAWSRNPADIAMDWAQYAYGGRAQAADVDQTSFAAAAAVCDLNTAFPLPSGTVNGPRFACDIVCRTDASPSDAFAAIVESMAGRYGWSGGVLRVRAGTYIPPSATIDENWIRGAEPRQQGDDALFQASSERASLQIVPAAPRTELVNIVRPTIADSKQAYVATPIKEIRADSYIAADGAEYPRDLEYAGITDAYRAVLVAQISLRESRNGLTCVLPCNMKAYQLELFDVVKVTLPRYGWADKTFEVIGWRYAFGAGVTLTLKETTAAIYDPAEDLYDTDLTPNTALPDPFDVPIPANIQLASGTAQLLRQADGTVVSRIQVTWTQIPSAAVQQTGYVEIRYGLATEPENLWTTFDVPGADTKAYIPNVQDKAYYLVKLRSLSSRRIHGEWSEQNLHLVVGKTALPANVSGFTATAGAGGVALAWTANTESDYAATEVRNGATWSSAVTVFKGKASTAFWRPSVAGTYSLLARHLDTTGNLSASAATTSVTVTSANLTNGVSSSNIIDASEWIAGSFGTQGTSPRRFLFNGGSAENGIELLNGPDGVLRPVWRSTSSDTTTGNTSPNTDGDGGWNTDPFDITNTKMYRYSVWVYCTGVMDGKVYLGCQINSVATIGGVGNAANPYFNDGVARSSLVNGRWYLFVGYVFPKDYAGTQQALSGYYDGVTGKKVGSGIDYKWATSATQSIHRTYQFYASIGAEQRFWGPRVDLCDGTEPTLDDLLAVSLTGRVVAAEDVVLLFRGTAEAYGNRIGKPSGAESTWDSDAYSRDGYRGGAFVSFVPEQTTDSLMVGLNSDPLTNSTYTSIDYAMYCRNTGVLSAYESGSFVQDLGTYAAGDALSVAYDGSRVRWMQNGTVLRDIDVPADLTLFLDSSFFNVGGYVRSVKFGPLTARNKIWRQTSAPTSATDGDIWYDTDAGNQMYVRDGGVWVSVRDGGISDALAAAANAQSTADGKIQTFYQTSAPSVSVSSEGDIWFDTNDSNKVYVFHAGAWAVATDTRIATALNDAATAQATADGKVTTFYTTTAPTAEAVGDLWYDTNDPDRKMYRWSGSAWQVISTNGATFGVNIVGQASTDDIAPNAVDVPGLSIANFSSSLGAGGGDTTFTLSTASYTNSSSENQVIQWEVYITGAHSWNTQPAEIAKTFNDWSITNGTASSGTDNVVSKWTAQTGVSDDWGSTSGSSMGQATLTPGQVLTVTAKNRLKHTDRASISGTVRTRLMTVKR